MLQVFYKENLVVGLIFFLTGSLSAAVLSVLLLFLISLTPRPMNIPFGPFAEGDFYPRFLGPLILLNLLLWVYNAAVKWIARRRYNAPLERFLGWSVYWRITLFPALYNLALILATIFVETILAITLKPFVRQNILQALLVLVSMIIPIPLLILVNLGLSGKIVRSVILTAWTQEDSQRSLEDKTRIEEVMKSGSFLRPISKKPLLNALGHIARILLLTFALVTSAYFFVEYTRHYLVREIAWMKRTGTSAAHYPGKVKKSLPSPKIADPVIKITGILYDENGPSYVIINNETLGVGDPYSDYTITAIERHRVQMKGKDKEIWIED